MVEKIIQYSVRHKLIILLLCTGITGFGLYSFTQIPITSVPDITNNQVQIITTSRNLATADVEKFLTYPVELEMANLPGIEEIRSISKFGLSVVTVVFNDDMGMYIPRQLIAEKIKNAEEKIPKGFGKPFMGPITTGLGEIYQYVIDVEEPYRDRYSLMDIRTIQDWMIKRQLAGIPGVVEINTWGGKLKQYEVAVNPERLKSLNVSISQIYQALEKNNSVVGGGYIEKKSQTYFIRGEGLSKTIADIENIIVENRNGTPIYVRDIAKVGYGYATRFGAITGNGEGEKVLGQIMMLKGADSKSVIKAIKDRIEKIAPTLPTGITINPFLERSELVNKTTITIAKNLILGCLIVVFVIMVFMGNIRAGLVVASSIPMCILFALCLMYIFGVDFNLMSLGAIDFGIIIDGAVIIVECIAFSVVGKHHQYLNLEKNKRQHFMDQATIHGANTMVRSAIFGQLIIIIVFIPIMSLTGVEGKMFKPMALVFCFALLGAMIFCFTYIPMMSALFIDPLHTSGKKFASKVFFFLHQQYHPILIWAMRNKKKVVGMAAVMLISGAALFSRMGGEFMPTLDEGDFVIQPVLKTGTSLSETIQITTQIEKIVKTFPEVSQVVSRIGAAEIPTDPMSMEESDIIVKLKPKNTWSSANSKNELVDKFKEVLTAQMAGIEFEFTQPIEMRFNELITGVKTDLAIKVFGDDLDTLYKKGKEIKAAIDHIEGAVDITVEKIAGLPQMQIRYDRHKIAKYGLNIEELNQVIAMGFGGIPATTIFEHEKQFDLVVRFDRKGYESIEDLKFIPVLLPHGRILPLREIADIRYAQGPAKIARDNTKRRVVIGVNVRNRDLESVVDDIQQIITKKITLPVGYSIDYGGQFENLKAAKTRLMILVPITLILVFIILYFAFGSMKEALIIYSAIPLAAFGGILLLYLRGIPFSISASIGFIALFGIVVLNGIILIEEFKSHEARGIYNVHKRILLGTQNRLRPVLLTGITTALGFLPMAISTSAGAEVQRPLATVVIGGILSATVLTLIILPVLYILFNKKVDKKIRLTLILITSSCISLFGQTPTIKTIDVEQAIQIALKNNNSLNAAQQRIVQANQLTRSAFDLNKTEVYYSYDENNIAPNKLPLRVWGVQQSLSFPTVYAAKKKIMKEKVKLAEDKYLLDQRWIRKKVCKAFYTIVYWKQMANHYTYLDSLYTHFFNASTQRFEQGETNYLEKLTAESKQKEIALKLIQAKKETEKSDIEFNQWLQSDTTYTADKNTILPLITLPLDSTDHPGIDYYQDITNISRQRFSIQKQKLLPDLKFIFFHGSNTGINPRSFLGFQVGIALPLWFGSHWAGIQAAKTQLSIAQMELENFKIQLNSNYRALLLEIEKHKNEVELYQRTGKALSKKLVFHAIQAFRNGEIDFLQYVQLLENSKSIEINYLSSLFQYNMAVLEANYIIE